MLKTGHLATDSQHKAGMLRHRAVEWAPRSSSGGLFSPVCGVQGSGGGGGCHWAVVSREFSSHIKKQRHCSVNKGPSSQGYGFFSSHVGM